MKPSRYCYTDNRDSAELAKVNEAEIKALRAEIQRLKALLFETASELKWKDEVIATLHAKIEKATA